ncbi:hypothetical protein MG293_012356 [Ovis ammon polii]|uniref:G-protein coupled receptors family 1 profile domain-containing protein n=1 Tax=Ovis ammon polii TaxID=230172 RepID=A0AAD4Y7S4_OVIAM|nr:hypothetical protein MG293_012356 [Ovis ammon polii]
MQLKWIVCEDNLNLLGYCRIYESVSFPPLLFNCSNHFPIPRASHKLFSPQGPEWSGSSVAQAWSSLEMALQLKRLKDVLGSCRMWSWQSSWRQQAARIENTHLSGDLICKLRMFPSWSFANISFFQPSAFLMIGIPGLEAIHGWISIPFFSMYTAALTGNCLILLAMFFLHFFSVVESSVLLSMSFDRFVAISNPLRYASVLTNTVITRTGLAVVARATVSLFPGPFLLKRLNFCPGKILLSHSFCFHADVMKRACADITVNIIYGLYVVLSTVGFDSLLIVLSYTLILHTVMSLASPRERIRALNTCVSHILAVLVFFIPVIGVSMIHRFGRHLPPIVHALVAYVYLVVPPVLNPIIYSVKSKPIREAMLRVLREKRKG